MTLLPSPPRPGELVDNRYHVLGELGRGSFGVVFEAEDRATQGRVALKFLLPRMALNQKLKERFAREAKLTSCLTSPNAVRIYDFGEYSRGVSGTSIPYMALEILDGMDLSEWLAAQPQSRTSLPVAMGILYQALTGLTQAHRMGIIHRDIKPDNLFLHKDPRGFYQLKVVDFGMAKAIAGGWDEGENGALSTRGEVLGTPAYMAPEQAQAYDDLNEAVDTYAIACVGFELIAGGLPYQGDSASSIAIQHITAPIPDLPGLPPDHPLVTIFRKAMAKDASDRFPDAGTFHEALKRAVAEADIQPETPVWDAKGHEFAMVDLDDLAEVPLVNSLWKANYDERATTQFKARPKPKKKEASPRPRHGAPSSSAAAEVVTTLYDTRKEEVTSMMFYEAPQDEAPGRKPLPLPLVLLLGWIFAVVVVGLLVLVMVVVIG